MPPVSDKSKRLAAVAMTVNGLLRNLFPTLPVSNEVNKRLGYPSYDGQCVRRYSLLKQLADIHNLFGFELVRRLVLPAQINKPCLPCVLAVSGDANPLKVFSPVVSLDPVDVIDAKAGFVAFHESKSDKPMHKEPCAFSVNTKSDFSVSGVVWLRCYLRSLSLARNGLRLSVAHSCVGVRSGRNANSAFATNFKRDSAFYDGFPKFHVRIISELSVCIIGGAS